ncbi:MAG: transcription antitermination factor NusB [bacterium]|nr:transcription antitermination factor NusB [bacterium]
MANRHLARSIVLQTLFEWDIRGNDFVGVDTAVDHNINEFAPGFTDRSFITALVQGVLEKQSELDVIIEKAAPEWPLAQIANVDRNILRMGLYELLFSDRDEVPAKVAINEAIELAKSFGGDSSGRFINGVLGTVYKELGEPGKNETSKPKSKKAKKDLTEEEKKQLPLEARAGAVVFARDADMVHLALVHDVFGYWTLSKGKLQDGENPPETAVREVREEIGIAVTIRATLGENEYIAADPQTGMVRRRVTYVLAEAHGKPDLVLKETGGLDDARWFSLEEVVDLDMYDDIRPLITKAIELLAQERA